MLSIKAVWKNYLSCTKEELGNLMKIKTFTRLEHITHNYRVYGLSNTKLYFSRLKNETMK